MAAELLAILVIGVLAVNLVVAWLLVRGNRDARELFDVDAYGSERRDGQPEIGPEIDPAAADPGPSGDPPPLSADDETATCRHCGAENRTGYRYCRWCVRSGLSESGRTDASEPSTTRRPF